MPTEVPEPPEVPATPGAPGPAGPAGAAAGGPPPTWRRSFFGNREARRPRPAFLVVGVVLAVALGIGLFTSFGAGTSGGRPQAGDPVPTFSLPRVGGGPAVGVPADGGGHGHPAVLLFFASWCGPCQAEIPALAATYRHQQATHSPDARVALIGVADIDQTPTAVRFLRKSGATFPSAADRTASVTNGLFYFTNLPEAVFVNGNGTVAAVHLGALSAATLVRWQYRLLHGS